MASPDASLLYDCFERTLLTNGALDRILDQANFRQRKRVYSAAVLLWLMILQRLSPRRTLGAAVAQLYRGETLRLLPACKRARERRFSLATGGYCQARQNLPMLIMQQVTAEMLEQLRRRLSRPWPGLPHPVFVLDGSSLNLEATGELRRQYPPGRNQNGQAHWPVLKIVVLHDLDSGLAERPQWGPMFGSAAVSEQGLAERALAALPAGSAVIADRNFGIFSTVWSATLHQHPVLVRLTDHRAKSLQGGAIAAAGDYAVEWKPGRWNRVQTTPWPKDAAVQGRLIAARVGRGKSQSWLYLFTTLAIPAAEVVALYGQRWNIETDLRSLKCTVGLQQIQAKSADMMEKELLIAVSAYNLVRAVMCLAARGANRAPRELSFAHAQNVVNAVWSDVAQAAAPAEREERFAEMLRLVVALLPKRPQHRSYPRRLWRRTPPFHFHQVQPIEEN